MKEDEKTINLRLKTSFISKLDQKQKDFGYETRAEFIRDILRFIVVADTPILLMWLEQAKRYLPFNKKENGNRR